MNYKIFKKDLYKIYIKIFISLITYGYIFYRLYNFYSESTINISTFFDWNLLYFLILAIFLMPVNWGIEAIKWKNLVKNIEKIDYYTSLKAVFAGITFAIFTPNRIGEVFGRSYIFKASDRIKGILATTTGSLAQLSVTIFIGFLSVIILVFTNNNPLIFNSNPNYLIVSILFSGFLLIIIFFSFLKFNRFIIFINNLKFLNKSKYFSKFKPYFEISKEYSTNELFAVWLFSILRYLIFSTQYYLILRFCNVNLTCFEAYIGISLTYLVIAFIPSIVIAEIGIRGSVAVKLIGLFSVNDGGIIMASFIIWIINVAIPSIIGSFIFQKSKF